MSKPKATATPPPRAVLCDGEPCHIDPEDDRYLVRSPRYNRFAAYHREDRVSALEGYEMTLGSFLEQLRADDLLMRGRADLVIYRDDVIVAVLTHGLAIEVGQLPESDGTCVTTFRVRGDGG